MIMSYFNYKKARYILSRLNLYPDDGHIEEAGKIVDSILSDAIDAVKSAKPSKDADRKEGLMQMFGVGLSVQAIRQLMRDE